MEHCESKTGDVCMRPATWKQSVHAGKGEVGRLLYHSYWCDVHAERVAAKRREEWIAPAKMTRMFQAAL
jgi:hypothetical protein